MQTAAALKARSEYLSAQAKLVRRLEAAGLEAQYIVEHLSRGGRRRFLVELLAPLDEEDIPDLETPIAERILEAAMVEFAMTSGLGALEAVHDQAQRRALEALRERDEEVLSEQEGE